MAKYFYCDICGETVFENQDICPNCKNYIIPQESIHDSEYYKEKSMILVGNYSYARQILIDEEISLNPLYNPDTEVHSAEKEYDDRIDRIFNSNNNANPNKPKCPTCGSENIKNISATSKIIGAAMWGLFSKTAHSQFHCNNCGYKW